MKWFGNAWGAPICQTVNYAPTPAGAPCAHCGSAIELDDMGVLLLHFTDTSGYTYLPWHLGCIMDAVGIGPDRRG